MAKITQIAVHHTGGTLSNPYAKSQHLTWQDIDKEHKVRFNFISSLGFYGGYNIYIEKTGNWKQFRLVGEETAAQKGFNLGVLSTCLAGNNNLGIDGKPVETPTKQQEVTLKNIEIWAIEGTLEKNGVKVLDGTEISIKAIDIHPHRYFAQTECYGSSLSENWARDLLNDYFKEKLNWLQKLILELQKLLNDLVKQPLGKFGRRSYSGSCMYENQRG